MGRKRTDPAGGMEIIQGTLDMLILKALIFGPRHGWDVLCWLRDQAGGELALEEGAIYPALYRLEKRGLIESQWGLSENNRRAKFYQLTDRGRNELTSRGAEWARYVQVVDQIMAAPGETQS
jgi:transcriptional regulator